MVPRDEFTPFGLVANPWAYARSWQEGYGGVLRATEQRPGMAWLEPWGLRPRRGIGLEIGFEYQGREFITRADFSAVGLCSSQHTANLFEYRWEYGGLVYRARFFTGGPDVLILRWMIGNPGAESMVARVLYGEWHWTADDASQPVSIPCVDARLAAIGGPERHRLLRADEFPAEGRPERVAGRPGVALRTLLSAALSVPPGGEVSWAVALRRGPETDDAEGLALRTYEQRDSNLSAEDEAFWATCPQLTGDWPAEFRRGFVYDFETTRMCLQPAGGIFKDVWPAWMVNWPRVVLAEGSLDMLRLSFAQPELAKRAVLSMFRDAPGPNVPCVFKHGEPNMVAADGAICGTSPAWCVPFHNLKLLYLRTLDRAWLAELYPYLAAYVRWWVEHRSDTDGWTVYKCTWEAGEDNSTRLDPDGEGDHVISQFARPIELQASMAHAAATLRFFERELANAGNAGRSSFSASPRPRVPASDNWAALERTALDRVRRLWDPREGRFRDLDSRRDGFIEPSGRNDYWGTDPRRFSALSLTPLLFGQTDAEQEAKLRREIEHYGSPPWCDWPSWSYVVLEAASRAGWHDFAGRMAYDICRRVYAENDRRDLATWERPLPGVAREYWPSDLSTWDASEGYGWGANTAGYVIRQLCGFYEVEDTAGCAFRLAPGFPPELVESKTLGIGPLPYRGRLVWLTYREAGDGELEVEVGLARAERLVVLEQAGGDPRLDSPAATAHRFRLRRGGVARVELMTAHSG